MLFKCKVKKLNGKIKEFYFSDNSIEPRQHAKNLLDEHSEEYTDLILEGKNMIRSQVRLKEKEENDWWKRQTAQIRFPDGEIREFDQENERRVKNGKVQKP